MTQARLTQEAQLARSRANEQRMRELRADMDRMSALINERRAAADRQTDERVARIIRGEVQRLEGTLDGYSLQFTDLQTEMSALRTRQDDFDTRLSTESGRTTRLVGRVDGLEACVGEIQTTATANATAIARLESANGWLPLACAAVTAVIVYIIVEWPIDWWLRDKPMATHIQWAWTIGLAAIVGIIATFLVRDDRVASRVSSSASSGVVLAPQPPADQPVVAAVPARPALQADAVISPPLPSSGNQFPSAQAAAAANASATS